ncbi:MAG: T9SS type A sorting domain-containing protein [Rhodothermaceae bacterium]|nr:T9SS type A sorting domain-containing protein [Rhodothermaceae bacterium]
MNQSDLLAVGLNFGRIQGVTDPDPEPDSSRDITPGVISGTGSISGAGADKTPFSEIVFGEQKSPAKQVSFPQIDEGKILEIDIITAEDHKLNILGVSYSYSIISGNSHELDFRYASPGSWARDGYHPNSMLRFQKYSDDIISGAVVHKGMVHTDLTDNLLMIRIAASQDLQGPLTLGDFRFSYLDANGNINRIDQVKLDYRVVTATGISGQPDVPQNYRLYQNYPNPFNPETRLRFDLPEAADVKLDVYTVTGQHVAALTDEFMPSGHHIITFDGARLASGVYIYRLQAGPVIQTRKMTLIK